MIHSQAFVEMSHFYYTCYFSAVESRYAHSLKWKRMFVHTLFLSALDFKVMICVINKLDMGSE